MNWIELQPNMGIFVHLRMSDERQQIDAQGFLLVFILLDATSLEYSFLLNLI